MKTTPISHVAKIACLALAAIGFTVGSSQAQVVIGDWQSSTAEGWYNNSGGLSITDPSNTGEYSFVAAGVPGFTQSLQINQAGYGSTLELNLTTIPADISGFLNNHLLSFTFAVPGSASTSGYSQIYAMTVNAPGYGYNNIPWTSTTAVNLAGANNNQSGQPNYYWGPSPSLRAETVTFDYSSILPAIVAGGHSYLQLLFTFNNGGGAPTQMFMNNVVLSGGPVPEPSTLALIGLGAAGLLVVRRRRNH
jgi:hypothetical protein